MHCYLLQKKKELSALTTFQLCNFWMIFYVSRWWTQKGTYALLGTSSGYSFVIIDCSYDDTLKPKQFMVFRQTIDESFYNDDRFQTMNH